MNEINQEYIDLIIEEYKNTKMLKDRTNNSHDKMIYIGKILGIRDTLNILGYNTKGERIRVDDIEDKEFLIEYT